MTTTPIHPATDTHPNRALPDRALPDRALPNRALRATTALALISGGALVVDTVTIAVINRNFDPLDSILFLIGFVGLWLTDIALSVHLSEGRRGVARVAAGAAAFVIIAAVLGGVSAVFDQLGRHVFSTSNIGLHGEWSFFTIGVFLLAIAVWGMRRQTGRSSSSS